jgi:hypothetical protein
MKTNSITRRITGLLIFAIIIAGSLECRAQHVITFTNGKELNAFIIYQSQDSVKYYLDNKPDIVYVETMDHIQRITPFHQLKQMPDSLSYAQCERKYKHYLHMVIGGPILLASGGAVMGLGIAGLVSLADEHDDMFTDGATAVCGVVTGIGAVGIIAGIAMTVTGALNLPIYKEKLNRFSFDFNYSPSVKGISLVYRF